MEQPSRNRKQLKQDGHIVDSVTAVHYASTQRSASPTLLRHWLSRLRPFLAWSRQPSILGWLACRLLAWRLQRPSRIGVCRSHHGANTGHWALSLTELELWILLVAWINGRSLRSACDASVCALCRRPLRTFTMTIYFIIHHGPGFLCRSCSCRPLRPIETADRNHLRRICVM